MFEESRNYLQMHFNQVFIILVHNILLLSCSPTKMNILSAFNHTDFRHNQINRSHDDAVFFFTNTVVDKIYVPVANYPLLSWMEIQDGTYPNSKAIKKEVQIGQPISIVVYVQDRSNLYDVIVSDCIAFNNANEAARGVQIYPGSTDLHKQKMLTWTKEKANDGNIVLYSTFPVFKLPDRRTMNITCNIEICYGACQHEK